GTTWTPTGPSNASEASVYELKYLYGTEQLLVATHGRGLWTADTSLVPTNAPTHLVATAAGTSVGVSWDTYSGATSYQLFRSSGGGQFTQIGGVLTGNSYTDSGLAAATTYLY